MHVGCTEGGVEIVEQALQRAPKTERLGIAPDEGGASGGKAHRHGIGHRLRGPRERTASM